MLAWLSVWSEVQTCIWPSGCHCHSLSVASVTIFFTFLVPAHPGSPRKRALDFCFALPKCLCMSLLIFHRLLTSPVEKACDVCLVSAMWADQPAAADQYRQQELEQGADGARGAVLRDGTSLAWSRREILLCTSVLWRGRYGCDCRWWLARQSCLCDSFGLYLHFPVFLVFLC